MKKCDGNHSAAENHKCSDLECWDDTNRAFNNWWRNEGSGLPPKNHEDAYEHVLRVTRIAWANGAYQASYGENSNCEQFGHAYREVIGEKQIYSRCISCGKHQEEPTARQPGEQS